MMFVMSDRRHSAAASDARMAIKKALIILNILIENNTLEKALTIKQSIGNDILSVSNINREVLTIKND